MLRSLLEQLTAEHVGWFGAGLSLAAVGVLGYQLLLASVLGGLGGATGSGNGLWPSSLALPGTAACTVADRRLPDAHTLCHLHALSHAHALSHTHGVPNPNAVRNAHAKPDAEPRADADAAPDGDAFSDASPVPHPDPVPHAYT